MELNQRSPELLIEEWIRSAKDLLAKNKRIFALR